jgi:hypothetical protein
VCLNELYLKDLLLNRRQASKLPYWDKVSSRDTRLCDYAFIRRKTVQGSKYTTLLYAHHEQLHHTDLRTPEGKEIRDELLSHYQLSWENDVILPYKRKYFKQDKGEDELAQFDFIVGPGQVIEVEDINERILYDSEEAQRRLRVLDMPLPLNDLKLTPRYDAVKPQTRSPSSITLEQCQAYDAFLDGLAADGIQEISFNALTSGENWQRIIRALEIQPNKNGQYTKSKLKRCYQKLGMFPSPKGKDILAGYSGIWYDSENCYMVGDASSFKFRQPRAHLIRRFDVYCGQDKFDIQLFLDTLAVPFVRYKQFTVYPYFFHLVDVYVSARLFFQSLPEELEEAASRHSRARSISCSWPAISLKSVPSTHWPCAWPSKGCGCCAMRAFPSSPSKATTKRPTTATNTRGSTS